MSKDEAADWIKATAMSDYLFWHTIREAMQNEDQRLNRLAKKQNSISFRQRCANFDTVKLEVERRYQQVFWADLINDESYTNRRVLAQTATHVTQANVPIQHNKRRRR